MWPIHAGDTVNVVQTICEAGVEKMAGCSAALQMLCGDAAFELLLKKEDGKKVVERKNTTMLRRKKRDFKNTFKKVGQFTLIRLNQLCQSLKI